MMKYVLLTVVLTISSAVVAAPADLRSPAAEKAAEECRAVLETNFQAMSAEDVKLLMGTISSKAGKPEMRAEFKKEAEKVFADTDIYMRVDGFELYEFDPPFAYAHVRQLTLPKNEEDHYPSEQGVLNFRHHSALLPEHQLVQYQQKFHYENGKWKLDRVITKPFPVGQFTPRLNASGVRKGVAQAAAN